MAMNDDIDKQYLIRFISRDKRIERLFNAPIAVPSETTAIELDELVNTNAKDEIDDWIQIPLSFIVNGVLLSSSLEEIVTASNLNTESAIDVECITREPAPQPESSIDDDDWVAAVYTTSNFIIAANYGGTLNVYSHSGKRLITRKFRDDSLRCVGAFETRQGTMVVAGGEEQTLTVCELENNELLPVASLRGHERSVECVAVDEASGRIVSGSFDRCIKLWSAQEDDTTFERAKNGASSKKAKVSTATKVPKLTLECHRDAVMGIAWSTSAPNQVVSVSWDTNMIVSEVETATVVETLASNKAHSRLSINTRTNAVLTASMDALIRLWDLRSKDEYVVKQRFLGHEGIVSDVAWAPANDHLFVSSSFDKTVRMWDVRSPTAPLYVVIGHNDHVLAVDWSLDSLIASAGKDATIKTYRRR